MQIHWLLPVLLLMSKLFEAVCLEAELRPVILRLGSAPGRLTLAMSGLLLVAAVDGKALAPFAIRRTGVALWAVGAELVPRGEVGLTFAQVGLSEGVLEANVFAELALVITPTTLLGPVLLRVTWPAGRRG